jgi:hypothetical protein
MTGFRRLFRYKRRKQMATKKTKSSAKKPVNEKPVLSAKKVSYIEVSYHAFEDFVKKCYPFIEHYDFPCVQECGNDSSHTFFVDKEKLDKWQQADWDKIKETGRVTAF